MQCSSSIWWFVLCLLLGCLWLMPESLRDQWLHSTLDNCYLRRHFITHLHSELFDLLHVRIQLIWKFPTVSTSCCHISSFAPRYTVEVASTVPHKKAATAKRAGRPLFFLGCVRIVRLGCHQLLEVFFVPLQTQTKPNPCTYDCSQCECSVCPW